MGEKKNIIFFGIDSLRSDHLGCNGYTRNTSPHIDQIAREGVCFKNYFSPNIPTTPGYASMLTGFDVINTQVVALRHKGQLREEIQTLPEILRDHGYYTSCVGFTGNPSSRGFDEYLDYSAWGSWDEGRLHKAEKLNDVAIPRLKELLKGEQPFLLFLRHMDPHAPYLPPAPFERLFYQGDECMEGNKSMEPIFNFKPFCDFHKSWMPPGITDKDYVVAQYDGEIAYMDACIQNMIQLLKSLGVYDETLIVLNSDHGETLYEHDCYFDHHGLYESNLKVPLIMRLPSKLPKGKEVKSYTSHVDIVPTILDLLEIDTSVEYDGKSLKNLIDFHDHDMEQEFYITECTWMRKHGWRSPEWKLIVALEPDFHFKPEVELYNLKDDPNELKNLAELRPDMVDTLKRKMEAWLTKRKEETGLESPIYEQGDWHGIQGHGAFKSSQEAYDNLYIGDANTAKRLQEKSR
ncbi:MAG: sulfatase [Deltaproteobacteria bacterium]|nr:sulfatase [Deltaproteobacteria bacterium]